MGIALALIVLMVITAAASTLLVVQVGREIDDLQRSYIPAYGDLARTNVRLLEQSVALRHMIISKLTPSEHDRSEGLVKMYVEAGAAADREILAARKALHDLLQSNTASHDVARLTALDHHVQGVLEAKRKLESETERLLPLLESHNIRVIEAELERVDERRDDLARLIESTRSEMLLTLRAEAADIMADQHKVILGSIVLTVLAALIGLLFSSMVSKGVTQPVRRLLEASQAVEAGRLDVAIPVTTQDEIGGLTRAFNKMVEQLRLKEHIRATFGKYIDPRVVEGLIDPSNLAAEGQRRTMTVLFCDLRGFTQASEGMTPQGLVKVMNRYFSLMSEPIRARGGVLDKYIGDSIMAYWGAPFVAEQEQQLACLAALDMLARVDQLRREAPELMGFRQLPAVLDIRIGIATGEVLVGSIGSESMLNYTVMGDAVNIASRLESANRFYGTKLLVPESTAVGAAGAVELRELDQATLRGQRLPQTIYEVMARKDELGPVRSALRDRYAEALAAYRARRWDEARGILTAALVTVPRDGPCRTLLERIDHFEREPPPANWTGEWRFDTK